MIGTPIFVLCGIRNENTHPYFCQFVSIFSRIVWNTIGDRYSSFVFYIETKPHFLIFASFQSIFTMAVRNNIDDKYSNFCIMQKRSHISLFLLS